MTAETAANFLHVHTISYPMDMDHLGDFEADGRHGPTINEIADRVYQP
jgi:hypothetical protein